MSYEILAMMILFVILAVMMERNTALLMQQIDEMREETNRRLDDVRRDTNHRLDGIRTEIAECRTQISQLVDLV